MQSKLPIAVLCGFLLMALAACGGGDDGARITELEADLVAEQEAREQAEDQAAEAEEKLQEEQAAREEAEEEAAEAEAAKEDAAEAEAALQDAEEAQQQAQQQLEQAQQESQQLQQQLTEAEQAELNARASLYLAAINTGGTDRTAVTVTYERGSTLKINPGGNFETGSGAPAISGFTPRTYTREVGVSGEQTLYLYTNIQAPGTRAFWKIHGLEVMNADGNATQNPTPTGSPQFINDPEDSDNAIGVRVGGTYDGVSGTYTCDDAGTCMGPKDDITLSGFVDIMDGQRSFATGNDWDFKPGSINSGVQQMRDTEHLYFGIWTQEPNVASEPHMYQYIVGGSNEEQGSVSAQTLTYTNLTGTAKFAGGAVGKYVTRDQVGDNAAIGTFTAAVNLTADFDDDTLEGRITNFRDGSRALTGWNVYLGGADNEAASFNGSVTNGVVAASIGGVNATGAWGATLHGTDNPGRTELAGDPDAATKYPLARYPVANLAGIVGNFHASSTNAALAGAFGATPQ